MTGDITLPGGPKPQPITWCSKTLGVYDTDVFGELPIVTPWYFPFEKHRGKTEFRKPPISTPINKKRSRTHQYLTDKPQVMTLEGVREAVLIQKRTTVQQVLLPLASQAELDFCRWWMMMMPSDNFFRSLNSVERILMTLDRWPEKKKRWCDCDFPNWQKRKWKKPRIVARSDL